MRKMNKLDDGSYAGQPRFWHMQLHPTGEPKFIREKVLELLGKYKVVGMSSEWDGDGGQPRRFEEDMRVGDVIGIRENGFVALARVTGPCQKNKKRDDLNWFEIVRSVEILDVNADHYIERYKEQTGFSSPYHNLYLPRTLREVKPGCKNTFLRFWYSSVVGVDEEFDSRIQAEDVMRPTKCRGGQAQYRAALLRKWNMRCAVTGITELELLRASHIKQFKVCRKDERYDVNNGLILAAHIDALFDSGLITFGDDGAIAISSKTSQETVKRLRLTGLSLPRLNPRLRRYLAWHRENVYKRG